MENSTDQTEHQYTRCIYTKKKKIEEAPEVNKIRILNEKDRTFKTLKRDSCDQSLPILGSDNGNH